MNTANLFEQAIALFETDPIGIPGFPENVIETYSGRFVDLSNPQPDSIYLPDILRGLENSNRYAGQSCQPFSVARHTEFGCRILEHFMDLGVLDEELLVHFVVHDFHEAYMGECPSPLKRLLSGYKEVSQDLDGAIYDCFRLPDMTEEQKWQVRVVDLLALCAERLSLYGEVDTVSNNWGFSPGMWEMAAQFVFDASDDYLEGCGKNAQWHDAFRKRCEGMLL